MLTLAQRGRGLLCQTDEAAIEARHLHIGRRLASSHQSLRRRTQCRTKTLHMDCRSRQNYPRCQAWAPSVRFDPLGTMSLGQSSLGISGKRRDFGLLRRPTIGGERHEKALYDWPDVKTFYLVQRWPQPRAPYRQLPSRRRTAIAIDTHICL